MQKKLSQNFIAILKCHKWRFLKAFLLVLFSNFITILNPLILRQGVNAVSLESYSNSYLNNVFIWAAFLLTVASIAASLKYVMRNNFFNIAKDAERQLRSTLFSRMQQQSRLFFDKHGIGDLLSRLTNDISAYRDVLGPGIMFPIFFTTLMIPGIFAMYRISPTLTFFSLGPLMVVPIFNRLISKPIYVVSRAMQKLLGEMSNRVQEHFSGIRIIKSYVVEGQTGYLFQSLCKQMIPISLKLAIMYGVLYPFFNLVTRGIALIIIFVFAYMISTQYAELNSADFVSFMWLQSYVFFPILMLAWVMPLYGRGKAAYQRIYQIYKEPIEVKDNVHSKLQLSKHAEIEFKHLTFRYPNTNKDILSGINLRIPPGSLIGLTGPIGAGKTTLFRLLSREYEIPDGMIYIDKQEIHEYSLEALRKEMVTVEQLPFLFSTTIAENLRFGRHNASQQELMQISHVADLHNTVIDFPEQYNTIVGERGVTLSGGQKQRLALARALLVNRSILLLDDVFSAVDAATENRIFQALKKESENKTIILISHKVSILEQMERILFMKEGRIVEDGSPSQLIAKKGFYSALVDLQKHEIKEFLL